MNLKINSIQEEKIVKVINIINEFVQFSDKMIFGIFPLDKAWILVYSAVCYVWMIKVKKY